MSNQLSPHITTTKQSEQLSFQTDNSDGICKGRRVNKTAACTALAGLTCGLASAILLPIYMINADHAKGGAYYGESVGAEEVFMSVDVSILAGGFIAVGTSLATYSAIKFWQNKDVVKNSLKEVACHCFDLCFPKKDLESSSKQVIINV